MLKLHEHLVSVLAQAVMFFVENYNCRSFVKEIIVEIIETGTEMDCYGQDNSSSRLFSNFIVEIATQQPQLILPCVELLIHNLNCDVRLHYLILNFLFYFFIFKYKAS